MEHHAIDVSVGDLREIIGIQSYSKAFVNLVRGGRIEMDRLPAGSPLRLSAVGEPS